MTSEFEYKKGIGTFKHYNILRDGFLVGKILVLDKELYFNPDSENAMLDFDIEELEIIIKIMKQINGSFREDK